MGEFKNDGRLMIVFKRLIRTSQSNTEGYIVKFELGLYNGLHIEGTCSRLNIE